MLEHQKQGKKNHQGNLGAFWIQGLITFYEYPIT